MIFKVRPDIIITAPYDFLKFKDYNYTDLSKLVSFYMGKINACNKDNPIGIQYERLSFHQIAFQLALIKTQRPWVYLLFNPQNPIRDDLREHLSHFFLVGNTRCINGEKEILEFVKNNPDFVTFTESENNIYQSSLHSSEEPLEIEFSKNQTIHNFFITKETTDGVYHALTTAEIEATCIKTAMDNYVHEDDVFVFNRPFKHLGVGTLIIYPALFKAKEIILASDSEHWMLVYHRATNVHLGYEMITADFPLPKKVRLITTGGYNFNDTCIEYLDKQCEYEGIIDCYGTKVLPPPMAIRRLEKGRTVPFTWVNNAFTFDQGPDNELLVTTKFSMFDGLHKSFNGDTAKIKDKILKLNDSDFMFYGQAEHGVRVNHVMMKLNKFVDFFRSILNSHGHTTIYFSIRFETINDVDNPVIVLVDSTEENINIVSSILEKESIEIRVK